MVWVLLGWADEESKWVLEGQEKRHGRVMKDVVEYPQCPAISLTGNVYCFHFVNW